MKIIAYASLLSLAAAGVPIAPREDERRLLAKTHAIVHAGGLRAAAPGLSAVKPTRRRTLTRNADTPPTVGRDQAKQAQRRERVRRN